MQIDINRNKSFSVSLTTEGMDISQMNFRFCLEMEDTIYSFPAELQGDSLKVVLPPLAEKIKELEPGNYNAYLETFTLNEDCKGYYLRPWQDTVELKREPRVFASVEEERDNSGIKAEIVEDENSLKQDKIKAWPEPPKSYTMKEHSDKKERKHTKFGKKLSGKEE